MTTMVKVAAEMGKFWETDSAPMRSLLERMLRLVVPAEATALCGAEHGERSEERATHRKGRSNWRYLGFARAATCRRFWRLGGAQPPAMNERPFVQVVAESYAQVVSTRSVDALLQATGTRGISKSEVSRMAADLTDEVQQFRGCLLSNAYPYRWLDALYVTLRGVRGGAAGVRGGRGRGSRGAGHGRGR